MFEYDTEHRRKAGAYDRVLNMTRGTVSEIAPREETHIRWLLEGCASVHRTRPTSTDQSDKAGDGEA